MNREIESEGIVKGSVYMKNILIYNFGSTFDFTDYIVNEHDKKVEKIYVKKMQHLIKCFCLKKSAVDVYLFDDNESNLIMHLREVFRQYIPLNIVSVYIEDRKKITIFKTYSELQLFLTDQVYGKK